MKRVSLILALIGFVVTGSLAIPHSVYADCKSAHIRCSIDGNQAPATIVATTTFTMCWSWKHLECRPCHGGAKWSYFAQWCNSNYQGCQNSCWGCYEDQNLCFDKQGNAYMY
ncbi:MAG: hypothetical protein PHU49_04210 [Syntrophorhabdaceae bacterium]|nr:hypothetical protein [Syntrophorhabdaceae bacterium]MDD5243199.1 hypothetical protein [Syntrophorhabdaceae bacterium]